MNHKYILPVRLLSNEALKVASSSSLASLIFGSITWPIKKLVSSLSSSSLFIHRHAGGGDGSDQTFDQASINTSPSSSDDGDDKNTNENKDTKRRVDASIGGFYWNAFGVGIASCFVRLGLQQYIFRPNMSKWEKRQQMTECLLILMHELGHAEAARFIGARVYSFIHWVDCAVVIDAE